MHQCNFFLGILLAILALLPAIYLDTAIIHYYLPGLIVLFVAGLRPQLRLALSEKFWMWMPWVLLLLFAVDLVLLVAIRDFMDALVRLNILLVCYRAISFRNRRDDLQLILVGLFLMIIVAINTVSVLFVMQIVMFAAVAMMLLFNTAILATGQGEETREEVWRTFSWEHFLHRLREAAQFRLIGIAAGLFFVILALSAAIFLVIPRLGLEQRLGFLNLQRVQSISGFSEEISLNAITDLQLDTRTALRIDPPSRDRVPSDPYWRMLALDEYDNGRFRVSATLLRSGEPVEGSRITPGDTGWSDNLDGESAGDWLFYLESGVSRWLPIPGGFQNLRLRGNTRFSTIPALRSLAQQDVNTQLFYYQLEDMVFRESFPDPFMEIDGWPEDGRYGEYREIVTELPLTEEERDYLHDTVDAITNGDRVDAGTFAARTTAYLQGRHEYSLYSRLPEESGDPIVRWLKHEVDGHCEYFAGAVVLLSRAAGFPARVVTGFHGGRWNSYENYLMVSYADAHAWVEIYDRDEEIWFRVDPTPPGDGEDFEEPFNNDRSLFGINLDESWLAYLDSLRVLWYRQIVSFDEERQRDFFAARREEFMSFASSSVKTLGAGLGAVIDWFRGPWDFGRILVVVSVVGVTGLATVLLQRLGWRIRRYFFFSGRRRRRLDPVRRRAGHFLRKLETAAGRHENGPAEPAGEWDSVRGQLRRLRYGAPDTGMSPVKVFRRARAVLRARRRGLVLRRQP